MRLKLSENLNTKSKISLETHYLSEIDEILSNENEDLGEIFEFEHNSTTELNFEKKMQLEIGKGWIVDIPIIDEQLLRMENIKLIEQNKKYLAIGLQWKERYKQVARQKKN
jgi:hypothetical protein